MKNLVIEGCYERGCRSLAFGAAMSPAFTTPSPLSQCGKSYNDIEAGIGGRVQCTTCSSGEGFVFLVLYAATHEAPH